MKRNVAIVLAVLITLSPYLASAISCTLTQSSDTIGTFRTNVNACFTALTGTTATGQTWELFTNIFGVAAIHPTTTVPIAVDSPATSPFPGSLEVWKKIAAPYFIATSSTASSTFPQIESSHIRSTNIYGTDPPTTTFFATSLESTNARSTGWLSALNLNVTNATTTAFKAASSQIDAGTSTSYFATSLRSTNA